MSKQSSNGNTQKAKSKRSTGDDARPKLEQSGRTLRQKALVLVGFFILAGGLLVICAAVILLSLLPDSEEALGSSQSADAQSSMPVLVTAKPVPFVPTSTPVLPTDEPPAEATEESEPDGASSLVSTIQPTPDNVFREGKVPILMYHYISEPPTPDDAIRVDLSVPPDEFEKQLAWLNDNGWTTITFYDFIQWLEGGSELPEKPVILTFDDGYRDNYENAFPLLQQYGQIGTFFILTGVTEAENPQYMTWDMLREMFEAGQSVEMHAHDHLDLDNRDSDFLTHQIVDSADILEAQLGYQPRFIAYPGGRFDDATIQAVEDAGYWMAVTTRFGWLHSSGQEYELKRVRIHGDYSLGQFAGVMRSVFEGEEPT